MNVLLVICAQLMLVNITKSANGILDNALHFWKLDNLEHKDKQETHSMDLKGETIMKFWNEIRFPTKEELGKVCQLDGESNYISINIEDEITALKSDKGISVSFWMKYESGDHIMSAGGYVDSGTAPGFRLQKDPSTNLFKLEVAAIGWSSVLFLDRFPSSWFNFLFTYDPNNNQLTLYINGKKKLFTKSSHQKIKKANQKVNAEANSQITFGKPDSLSKMSFGKFQMTRLALWKQALSPSNVERAYEENIIFDKERVCCQLRLIGKPCSLRPTYKDCLCADVDTKECIDPIPRLRGCLDTNAHCNLLVNHQNGYCENMNRTAAQSCPNTCNICYPTTEAMKSPREHFNKKIMIFSILGCVGGVLFLFGAVVYFWKVYRTRCHGTFEPPLKSVSILDVPEYDDEKWPNKFMDSNAFYIKDVPPKKRALPLIPAKNSQSNHRYQPPEFD